MGKMKKVLLVDDDRLNTTMIRFILRERYDVITAQNGRQGLAAVQKERPDLIILDVQMPEMSGFEFMNELKSLPGGTEIPVIMLTANENMQELFLGEGVKGYFVKPVDTAKLEAKIKDCLG
jgi:CheY-like chemotaxis protein